MKTIKKIIKLTNYSCGVTLKTKELNKENFDVGEFVIVEIKKLDYIPQDVAKKIEKEKEKDNRTLAKLAGKRMKESGKNKLVFAYDEKEKEKENEKKQ